jgi:hypothetical protein
MNTSKISVYIVLGVILIADKENPVQMGLQIRRDCSDRKRHAVINAHTKLLNEVLKRKIIRSML